MMRYATITWPVAGLFVAAALIGQEALLHALGANPSQAYAQTKRDLRGTAPQSLASDAALDQWLRESIPTWTSSELKARVAAVLRK